MNNPKTRKPRQRRTYHHGELREAMLEAGERLLSRDGLDGFTLRACAREAGVSHAAPAHHFRDLAGLVSALSERALARLTAAMDRHSAGVAQDPLAIVPALGVSYVDFALRHPGLYRLMFRSDSHLPIEPCRDRLSAAVRLALTDGSSRPVDEARVQEVAILVWSLVHGYALLALDGQLGDVSKSQGRLLDCAGRVLLQLQPLFPANQA